MSDTKRKIKTAEKKAKEKVFRALGMWPEKPEAETGECLGDQNMASLAPDPIEDLFSEVELQAVDLAAVTRRVRLYVNEHESKVYQTAQENMSKAIAELNSERAEILNRCSSLQGTIREMTRDHADQLINAITRASYGAEQKEERC